MTAHEVPLAAGHPVVGSMIELQRDALGAYLRARDEQGDVVRFAAGPPGMRMDFYAVFSASGAHQVLAGEADNFRKDNKFYDEARASLGNGMLTSQDEVYERQRAMVKPLFDHAHVDSYADLMVAEVERSLGDWEGVHDVRTGTTRLAMRMMGRVLFGADVDAAISTLDRCFPIITNHAKLRAFEPHSIPRSVPTPRNRRAAAAQREVRAVCDRLVAERRSGGSAPAGETDLLGLLTEAGDGGLDAAEVRDQVLIFVFGGHETTATALTFTLHLLGLHPEIQDKVYAEVDDVLGDRSPTAADLTSLSYLTMVVKEAMRLYPPAPMVGRQAVEETVVDGYRIPAGADIFVSSWVTHRHPAYWSDPSLFRPERFEPGGEAERHEGAWFPFGDGRRGCVATYFSMMQTVLALAVLLRAYRFESIDQEIKVTHGITLEAISPARCEITPR